MHLTLVTGGARSGKSDHAEQLATRAGGERVTFIATAQPGDDEMAARIARHRARRPNGWTTVEAPFDPAAAIARAATPIVLLDCLTLLASNLLLAAGGRETEGAEGVGAQLGALLAARDARDGALIVVTNEVGLGIVPATALGRIFRDVLGEANRRVAAAADSVLLMVSGLPIYLAGFPSNEPYIGFGRMK